jgi:Flp pilus assembly protein TadG
LSANKNEILKPLTKDYTMKLIQNQKGVALVEFAIALPLILLLLFGTIEFGVLFYNKQVITNASREGVRTGIAAGTSETIIRQIVKDYSNDKLICLNNSISIADGDIQITPDGEDLIVSVNVAYTFLYSQIIGLGNTIDISASTVMRMEPTTT